MIEIRGQDKWGAGHFGASRGDRKHLGVDVCCKAGEIVKSLTYGLVTKIGYPYNPNDPDKGYMRYVEVTLDGNRFRYFYLNPVVTIGQRISPGDSLGISQDLNKIYSGITQHYHFEIINPDGNYVDPKNMIPTFLEAQEKQDGTT